MLGAIEFNNERISMTLEKKFKNEDIQLSTVASNYHSFFHKFQLKRSIMRTNLFHERKGNVRKGKERKERKRDKNKTFISNANFH